MKFKPDASLYEEYVESGEWCSYEIWLANSLEIQKDILAQEPREADLTEIYMNALRTELAKF
jgi:hypothetical protein